MIYKKILCLDDLILAESAVSGDPVRVLEDRRLGMMKADISIPGAAVMAAVTVFDNISDRFLPDGKLTGINASPQLFDHAAVFVTADPGIAVTAVPFIITHIIRTDPCHFYTKQHLVFFWFRHGKLCHLHISRPAHKQCFHMKKM